MQLLSYSRHFFFLNIRIEMVVGGEAGIVCWKETVYNLFAFFPYLLSKGNIEVFQYKTEFDLES